MKLKKLIGSTNADRITVITETKVHYSGAMREFYQGCDPDMLGYRNRLCATEVLSHDEKNGHLIVFLVPDEERRFGLLVQKPKTFDYCFYYSFEEAQAEMRKRYSAILCGCTDEQKRKSELAEHGALIFTENGVITMTVFEK